MTHIRTPSARFGRLTTGAATPTRSAAYRLLRDDPDAVAQQLMQQELDKRSEWRGYGLSIPDERLFGHA